MGIVVLSLAKNISLLNDSLAYRMTMAGGVGGGVYVGARNSGGVWVVCVVMVKAVVMVAVGSVVGVLHLVNRWWLWQRLCWWGCAGGCSGICCGCQVLIMKRCLDWPKYHSHQKEFGWQNSNVSPKRVLKR